MVHLLEKMEVYAREFHVPIMEKDGMEFLLKIVEQSACTSILEIGTAIGYSAIRMALISPSIHITTIERDLNRYQEALKNIEEANLTDQITVILADALESEVSGAFDLIFIDAAKSQYIKFFERYRPLLKPKGLIVSDNLGFHGLVAHPEEITSKNVRSMVRKIQSYREFLEKNPEFETNFYEIGDGIGVSQSLH